MNFRIVTFLIIFLLSCTICVNKAHETSEAGGGVGFGFSAGGGAGVSVSGGASISNNAPSWTSDFGKGPENAATNIGDPASTLPQPSGSALPHDHPLPHPSASTSTQPSSQECDKTKKLRRQQQQQQEAASHAHDAATHIPTHAHDAVM